MGRRVSVYARVSLSRQDLDGQLMELREFAARRGWAVAGVYSDIISGARAKRPGLDALLRDAHQRKFDAVVVWKLDRLGRSLVHLVQVLDDLLTRGIDVVSATEPHMDSTTPGGRLLRNIIGSVAEYERDLIRERVRAGVRRARARRTHWGRPPSVVIDVARARELQAQDLSLRAIARALGAHPTQVRRALDRA